MNTILIAFDSVQFLMAGWLQLLNHECNIGVSFKITKSKNVTKIELIDRDESSKIYQNNESITCYYGDAYKFTPCYCNSCNKKY